MADQGEERVTIKIVVKTSKSKETVEIEPNGTIKEVISIFCVENLLAFYSGFVDLSTVKRNNFVEVQRTGWAAVLDFRRENFKRQRHFGDIL